MEFDRTHRGVTEAAAAAALPLTRCEPASIVLREALYPPPTTSLGHAIAAAIERSIEELITETPWFVVPGHHLTNFIGDGEKRIFHTPELRDRRELKWPEVLPFIEEDRAGMLEVARHLERTTGAACDFQDVLAVMTGRMKYLLRESILAANAAGQVRFLESEISERSSRPLAKLLGLLPGSAKRDRELAGKLAAAEAEQVLHSTLHGGDYEVCPLRSGISHFRRLLDSMWYHRRSLPASAASEVPEAEAAAPTFTTLRINSCSIALAQLGIFEKGTAGWDQQYPSSPLEFWSEHINPYVRLTPPGSAASTPSESSGSSTR